MRGKPALLDDFGGGVDVVNDPRELPPNVASSMSNVVPAPNGRSIKSRPWAEALFTPTEAVAVIAYSPLTGNFVYADTDGDLYSYDGSSSTKRFDAADTAGNGRGWSVAHGIIASASYIFFMHPTLAPQFWNGVAASTTAWTSSGSGLPTGSSQILWRGNRMWAIKGDTLHFSDLGLADTWTSTNFVKLQPGDTLLAMCDCGPYIAVFSSTRIWVIYDFDTGANRLVSDRHGITGSDFGTSEGSRACASALDGCYFATDDNVFFTDGNRVQRIGDPVSTLLSAEWPVMVLADRFLHYRPDGSTYLLYDTELKSWWIQGFTPTTLAAYPTTASVVHAGSTVTRWNPLGSATSGIIYAFWERQGLDFGSQRRKRVRSVQVIGDSVIDWVMLYRDGTDKIAIPSFDGAGRARIATPGVSREWGIFIAGTNTAQWELNEVAFEVQERKD